MASRQRRTSRADADRAGEEKESPALLEEDLESYNRLLVTVMDSEVGRVAWLMGFLTGSALIEDNRPDRTAWMHKKRSS